MTPARRERGRAGMKVHVRAPAPSGRAPRPDVSCRSLFPDGDCRPPRRTLPRSMSRSLGLLAVVAVALVACDNSYQFAPAGHCLLQPGSVQVRLDPTSSADLLFVVDDSPSTNEKQVGLASSFKDFIDRSVETNVARIGKGLQPIDFRIAVTTSSVLEAKPVAGSCVAGAGGPSCCQTSACTDVASCTRGTADGCGGGQVCVARPTLDGTGQYVIGERSQCCAASACLPSPGCSPGDSCPAVATAFPNPLPPATFCTPGLAIAGQPYPAGAFVAAGSNPKVLEFPKQLGWASWNTATPDATLTALVSAFQGNVRVGSCGSGEEQHLEAARLALEKAAAGQLPGVTGPFPRPGAKLVLVWVGDEDDCSSPANAPLVMEAFSPGADSCVFDKHRPAALQREIPVSAYADFFTSLVHPGGPAALGAAFIASAARCVDGSYAPADSCTGPASCPTRPPATCAPPAGVCGGAFAAGERFFQLADALQARGVQVVEGTVCDAYPPSTFGPVLSKIADLLPPPSSLHLPTAPAARAVTSVVIQDAQGATRKTCRAGSDWCFVDCGDRSATPACLTSGTSECIAINHATGSCEADAGEAYVAEYLGVVPAGGCAAASDCQRVLGGKATDWTCTKDAGQSRGTCTCAGP
jgi:hypothetical protein